VWLRGSQPGGSLATKIYGGPTGSEWEVEESIGMVINKIASAGLLSKD
jgi:hypothetical protein